MAVYSLILKKDEPIKIRFQAFVNLFCVIYFASVTLLVTHTAFSMILPACYHDQSWMYTCHSVSICYLFMCVLGNFVTCVLTDPGVNDQKTQPFSQGHLRPKQGKSVKKEFLRSFNERTRIVCKNKGNGTSYTLHNMHFCTQCNLIVPARTHHCMLCKKCVAKRDHHCFFMGVCIGKANHLYFIYFTLYMGIGTFYGMLLLAKYMFYMYGIRFYGPQTFISLFLNTMLNLLNGSIPSARYLFIFIQLYLSLFGATFALSFFFWHILIVSRGQTTYEARQGIKKFSKDGKRRNFQEVFKSGWRGSLFVPFLDLLMNKNRNKHIHNQ